MLSNPATTIWPAASSQQPAASSQQPAASSQIHIKKHSCQRFRTQRKHPFFL